MVNPVQKTNFRKEKVGVVVSDKMQKTIVVRVSRKGPHANYGKVIEKFVKFKAHDEENKAKTGDKVRIAETRPLSKDKRWRLVEILSHGYTKSDADIKDTVVSQGTKS